MADKKMEAQISVEFEEATSRQSLNSGETINTLWSKVKRWLSDLKAVAFSGSYNDLSDKPTAATTDTDGLMSTEDKGKLDAFEITTTGGKLHDKDIATTETLSRYLPLTGGMTTGTTGLAGNFRAVSGNYTRLQLLINNSWSTAIWGDNSNNGCIFGNGGWKSLKLNVDSPEHAYVNEYPIYSAGYKPFAAGSFGKSAEEATVDCGFAPTYALIFSCGGNPVIYSSESEEITLSDTGFTVNASVAENTYSYVAFR